MLMFLSFHVFFIKTVFTLESFCLAGWPKELTNSGVNLQERLYQLESATKSTACKDVSNIEKLYKEKCRKKRFDLQCNIL